MFEKKIFHKVTQVKNILVNKKSRFLIATIGNIDFLKCAITFFFLKIEEQGRFSDHGHVSCIEDGCKSVLTPLWMKGLDWKKKNA